MKLFNSKVLHCCVAESALFKTNLQDQSVRSLAICGRATSTVQSTVTTRQGLVHEAAQSTVPAKSVSLRLSLAAGAGWKAGWSEIAGWVLGLRSRAGWIPILNDRMPPAGVWDQAGVEGGIPKRTTICKTVTADTTGASSAVGAISAHSMLVQTAKWCSSLEVRTVSMEQWLLHPIFLTGAH
jgi:hypothetical protein